MAGETLEFRAMALNRLAAQWADARQPLSEDGIRDAFVIMADLADIVRELAGGEGDDTN